MKGTVIHGNIESFKKGLSQKQGDDGNRQIPGLGMKNSSVRLSRIIYPWSVGGRLQGNLYVQHGYRDVGQRRDLLINGKMWIRDEQE